MKVRILVGFNGYEAGQVFEDWPSGMCDGLIAMGAIEEVKGDDQSVATAPDQAGPRTATKAEKKRG